MKPNSDPQYKLQKPGAGLPLFQRLYLRWYLGPFVAKKYSVEDSQKLYETLISKIIDAVEKIPESKRDTKVMVMPIAALEDSSRYWSLNMVLEHLDIFSTNFDKIIEALSNNRDPGILVDVAKVKPLGTSAYNVTKFKALAPDLFKNILKKSGNVESKKVHYHPWFGDINARQWCWLLATHNAIHWKQIKQIIEGLR